jgi:cell division protease FtsH
MQKILSRRAVYRSGADPDDMKKLKDLARAVALGQMKAATRPVPQVARHDMPVCVGIVAPTESLSAFELALRRLAWPRSDTYGLPMHVGVHVFASHDESRRAEKDGFWLKERLFVLVPSRGLLPHGFEAVADLVAEIGAPSPRLIAGAARQCLGIRLSEAEAEEAASYPLDSLSKAFRSGRTPARALKALREMASDARMPAAASEGPTLDDLPGMGEAADWGRQLAVDLKDWEAGRIRWEEVDRGVLLSGPPGCGKTSFATALARTCGTAIVLGSLARWQSMGHMGDLLKAMRRAFDEATKSAPCILFVDEVDSFGDRERLAASSNNEQYCREVINGFLECLDGAAGREGVVVVGATNYPDALDAGIRRPGRLDRHIAIPLPDAEARARILRLHLRADVGSEGFAEAARRTEGWSGARLEQLARDARRGARAARRPVAMDDIRRALPARTRLPDGVRRVAAVHEAGHAIVGAVLGRVIEEVTISAEIDADARTGLGGRTVFADEGSMLKTPAWFRNRIAVLLAGMAAEEMVFGTASSGAGGGPGSDLFTATIAAATLEASYGLGGGLSFLSPPDPRQLLAALEASRALQLRVERVLQEEKRRAKDILDQAGHGRIDDVAGRLLAGEALTAACFAATHPVPS